MPKAGGDARGGRPEASDAESIVRGGSWQKNSYADSRRAAPISRSRAHIGGARRGNGPRRCDSRQEIDAARRLSAVLLLTRLRARILPRIEARGLRSASAHH